MRFKPGQKVVCKHRGTWISTTRISKTSVLGSGPQFNEICTIYDYLTIDGMCGLSLVGYEVNQFTGRTMLFTDRWFEPLVDDSVLEAELQSITQFEEKYLNQKI